MKEKVGLLKKCQSLLSDMNTEFSELMSAEYLFTAEKMSGEQFAEYVDEHMKSISNLKNDVATIVLALTTLEEGGL